MQLQGDLVHDVGPAAAAAALSTERAVRRFGLRGGLKTPHSAHLQRIIELLPGRRMKERDE
jgi:hypothetical protein